MTDASRGDTHARVSTARAFLALTVVLGLCALTAVTASRLPGPAAVPPAAIAAVPGTPAQLLPWELQRLDAARNGGTGFAAGDVIPLSSGPCLDVPILVYHYIRIDRLPNDRAGWLLSVPPQEFREQMDWLKQAGGHPVTLEQVMAALQGGPRLPPHPVALTFDDGYEDFYTQAFPVLMHEGFVATEFVVPGFLTRAGYMTAAQVEAISTQGIVIGAHTMHHVDLPADNSTFDTVEIDLSRGILQGLIRRPVLDFAYPYGAVDARVEALVQRAGFRDAVTMATGTTQCSAQRLQLHRIRVGGKDSVRSFAHSAGIPAPPAGWIDPAAATPLAAPPAPGSIAGSSR